MTSQNQEGLPGPTQPAGPQPAAPPAAVEAGEGIGAKSPDVEAAQDEAPLPVPTPTFAEQLMAAISQFSSDVKGLTSLDASVAQAVNDKAAAQVALTVAQGSEETKVTERAAGRSRSIDSRDNLVAVLQSWTP